MFTDNLLTTCGNFAAKFLSSAAPVAAAAMRSAEGCSNFSDERMFSGATIVVDFSAHPHKDMNNVPGGATAILSLVDPEQTHDNQLHIIHNYTYPEVN